MTDMIDGRSRRALLGACAGGLLLVLVGPALAADSCSGCTHTDKGGGKGGNTGPAAAHGAKKGAGRHASPSDGDTAHGGLEDKVFRGKGGGGEADDPEHEHDPDKHADGEEHDDQAHDSDTHADGEEHDDQEHEGGKGLMKGRKSDDES